jgi:hypothetical protein
MLLQIKNAALQEGGAGIQPLSVFALCSKVNYRKSPELARQDGFAAAQWTCYQTYTEQYWIVAQTQRLAIRAGPSAKQGLVAGP